MKVFSYDAASACSRMNGMLRGELKISTENVNGGFIGYEEVSELITSKGLIEFLKGSGVVIDLEDVEFSDPENKLLDVSTRAIGDNGLFFDDILALVADAMHKASDPEKNTPGSAFHNGNNLIFGIIIQDSSVENEVKVKEEKETEDIKIYDAIQSLINLGEDCSKITSTVSEYVGKQPQFLRMIANTLPLNIGRHSSIFIEFVLIRCTETNEDIKPLFYRTLGEALRDFRAPKDF